MRIAITGGTGFLGRNLARSLAQDGHQVVVIARGKDQRDDSIRNQPGVSFASASVGEAVGLERAFAGCDAVAHCAGINREIGGQTYARVHVDGAWRVVAAARQAGVKKIVFVSFLRARPDCGSPYHELKWAAEEIIRGSGLDYTIFKPGVIYGRGDHMLDHLARTFETLPLFGLVGLKDQSVAPLAVEDFAEVLKAALVGNLLSRETVAVTGPETMALGEAVARVAAASGRHPRIFRLPVWFHMALAWLLERIMKVPLVSLAQVHILAEGIVARVPGTKELPEALKPRTFFSAAQIKKGLPPLEPFGFQDLRCPTCPVGSRT